MLVFLIAPGCTGADTEDSVPSYYFPPGLVVTCDEASPMDWVARLGAYSSPLVAATFAMPDYGVELEMTAGAEQDLSVALTYPRTLGECLDATGDWARVEWTDEAGSGVYQPCMVQFPDGEATCDPP